LTDGLDTFGDLFRYRFALRFGLMLLFVRVVI
jgi:hypothetical protein